jgi:Type IV secretion-system coupling protein DNA-binding domain
MVWLVVQVALTVLFAVSTFALVYVLQDFAKRFIDEGNHQGPKNRKVVRGQELVTLTEAASDLEKNSPPATVVPRTLYVGGLWHSRDEETNNRGTIGVVGTGKTKLAEIDMANAFSRIANPIDGEQVGGIVVDYKRESIPILAGIVGPENIINLNPFDARSVAPDNAKMFDSEARINQLASVLVRPKQTHEGETGSADFWVQSGQDAVSSVTLVFHERAPGCWELRDQLEACASIPRLRFVLKQSPQTRHLVDTYLSNEVLARNILASLRANLRDWRPVAAIWARTPRKIHFGRFVEELGQVLVLQPDVEKDLTSKAVQRLVLQRLFEYGLMLPSSRKRRIFLFGDEIQELGRIDKLDSILSTGRSRGWAVYLYTQTIDGMLKEYGEHMTEKMLSNISSWTFFSSNGRTAEWVARKFGKNEVRRIIEVINPADESKKSMSPQYQMTDAVLPVEVSGILPPTPERGLTSINISRLTRPFFSTVKGLDRLLPRPMPGIPEFVPRPSSDEVLEPWTLEDLRRLNLKVGPDDDLEAILGVPQPVQDDGDSTPVANAVEENSAPDATPGIIGKLLGRGRFGRKGGDK